MTGYLQNIKRQSASMTHWLCNWRWRERRKLWHSGVHVFLSQKMASNSPMAIWLILPPWKMRAQSRGVWVTHNYFPNAPLLKEKQSAWNLGHVTEGRKARASSQRTSSILWAQDHLPSVQYKIMLIFALLVCGLWKPIARKVLLL